MFQSQFLNWKTVLFAGAIATGIVGGGYGIANHFAPQQTVGKAIQPGPEASAIAAEVAQITVYRTPTCGCCEGWVEHMKENNFQVTDIVKPEAEIQAVRQQHNLPGQLRSCHAAEIGGYLVEGHVPAEDVRKLVAQKPDLAGIAVPGMPIGTPGMEVGDRRESFDVLGFQNNGDIRVFNSYQF
jgi:hypothetical protein